MKHILGCSLVGWPFLALAYLAGWDFVVIFSAVVAIVVSVFVGVWTLTSEAPRRLN